MPVKFVTKVLKGLLGGSETAETDEETSVTVERETGHAGGASSAEIDGEDDTDEGVGETDERADDTDGSEDNGQTEDTDESADTGEHPGADVPVDEIRGVGPTYSERLTAVGIETVADVAAADIGQIADAAEVSESRASDWQSQATDW